MSSSDPAISLLTFDVEEFDAPLDRGRSLDMATQLRIGSEGFRRVLDLLDELAVPATLFITANLARHSPDLVRRAAARHEIASHGFHHRSFENADLARSREVLREISGQEVLGFRRARLQATDPQAILDAGYRWDSSENPIWLPGRYNNLRRPRTIYRRDGLVELPASASPRLRIPLFWLAMKNLPMALVRAASAACLRRDGYLSLYWHPWEFLDLRDSGLPRYMRRPDGEAMCRRLAGYVRWLLRRSRAGTISAFVEARSRSGAIGAPRSVTDDVVS